MEQIKITQITNKVLCVVGGFSRSHKGWVYWVNYGLYHGGGELHFHRNPRKAIEDFVDCMESENENYLFGQSDATITVHANMVGHGFKNSICVAGVDEKCHFVPANLFRNSIQ